MKIEIAKLRFLKSHLTDEDYKTLVEMYEESEKEEANNVIVNVL
jgi:hypothetical protein